jgi:CBS domain-containing protein
MPNAKLAQVTTTNLVAISCNDSLDRAAEVLAMNGIRHLPVLNNAGIVVGIISDRDLLRASMPLLDIEGMPIQGNLRFLNGTTVLQYMSTALRAVTADASVQEAIDLMLREKISSCLVVDAGKVIGIITYEDMMDLFKSYIAHPKGSLRSTVASFVASYPLGQISHLLSVAGI